MAVKGNLIGKLEKTIEGLEINEEAFTLPWALNFEVREDGRCNVYLNVKYPVLKSPYETFRLPIKKIGPKKEDYEVDLEGCDFKYSVEDRRDYRILPESIVCIGEVDMF